MVCQLVGIIWNIILPWLKRVTNGWKCPTSAILTTKCVLEERFCNTLWAFCEMSGLLLASKETKRGMQSFVFPIFSAWVSLSDSSNKIAMASGSVPSLYICFTMQRTAPALIMVSCKFQATKVLTLSWVKDEMEM